MLDRVAAAPISWGICEVPGWGVQLPVDRVLSEMAALGIRATELGALGWLPTDPAAIRTILDRYELQLVGGFVPLVLHDPATMDAARADAERAAALLAAAGGTHFVTAVVSDPSNWQRPALDDAAWATMIRGIETVDEIASGFGLTQVVHPHVDTLIEIRRRAAALPGRQLGVVLPRHGTPLHRRRGSRRNRARARRSHRPRASQGRVRSGRRTTSQRRVQPR